jgi:hypothetical protein
METPSVTNYVQITDNMPLGTLEFRPTAAFHCHFRDGDMMEWLFLP